MNLGKIKIFSILVLLTAMFLLNFSCSLLKFGKDEAVKDTSLLEPGMVLIPGTKFNMGSPYKKNEGPIHSVNIDTFFLDKKEVSVYEFTRFCKATRRKMPVQPTWADDDHPVVNVTWNDARDYAKWSRKRLPTEAEWEYASRSTEAHFVYSGKSKNIYQRSFGNIADESFLTVKLRFPIKEGYDDGYIHSAPGGSYPENVFGVSDLEGNVLEWCADWFQEDYYAMSERKNPQGPQKGNYKIIRGGSWNRAGAYLRSTYRTWYPPACAFEFLGFRCAKDYDPSNY